MKKLYTVILLFVPFLFHTVNAQSRLAVGSLTPISVSAPLKQGNPSLLTIDTLRPPTYGTPCGDSIYYYYIDRAPHDSGYAFGNNKYGETECAQKYYATGTVSEVLVLYPHKYGTAGTNMVKLYSIDGTTKGPSATVLGTSNSVTTANLATGFTTYSFSPTVSVTTSFAASVVFPTNGDTVTVGSTRFTCVAAPYDSLSWENIPAYGGWGNTNYFFTGNKTNSVDFHIWVVLNVASGMNEYPSSNGLTLMGAYPNPAQDFTNIRYSLIEATTVSVEVFDLTGRIIEKSSENFSAGSHDIKISLKNLSAGNYYYTIKTEKTQLTSKFVVTK